MRKLLGTTLLAAGLTLSACASNSGGISSFDKASISASSKLSDYNSVYIADVQISPELLKLTDFRPRKNDNERPLRSQDIQQKAADLKRDLANAVGPVKQMAAAPGEGVLTITPVLTDLKASRVTMADMNANPSLSQQSLYTGKAAARFEFSENGRSLGSVSDTYTGDFRDAQYNTIWSDADHAFSRWSRNIAAIVAG